MREREREREREMRRFVAWNQCQVGVVFTPCCVLRGPKWTFMLMAFITQGANSSSYYTASNSLTLLSFVFVALANSYTIKMDSNLDCWNRSRARWPFDHHYGPYFETIYLVFKLTSYINNCRQSSIGLLSQRDTPLPTLMTSKCH